MSSQSASAPTRRTALVLEVELPEFYAEDLRADDPNWQSWLSDTGTDPSDAAAVGQEILGNLGEVYTGLLTIHVTGEKDGSIVRTPVLMVGARAEDRPPESEENWKQAIDDLKARADEDVDELRMMAACDAAMLKVLEPFARRVARLATAHDFDEQPAEYKTVVGWAVEAMEAANKAEEEAERDAR